MTTSNRKKVRRAERKQKNINKEIEHKKSAWESGKLIEENHNQGPYSIEYSIELGNRLKNIIDGLLEQYKDDPDKFLIKYRMYKIKIRDLILHWNPECDKAGDYDFLKRSLEVYWDYPDKMLFLISKKND